MTSSFHYLLMDKAGEEGKDRVPLCNMTLQAIAIYIQVISCQIKLFFILPLQP